MASYTNDMTIAQMLQQRLQQPDAPTQTELAHRFGVSQATISRWAKGLQIPGPERAFDLAQFLGVHEHDVIMAGHRQVRQEKARIGLQMAGLEAMSDIQRAAQSLLELAQVTTEADRAKLQEAMDLLRSGLERIRHATGFDAEPLTLRDEQFAQAAEGGATERQGPSRRRPSPPPEPEGP